MKSMLFLGKKIDEHCRRALEFVERNFDVTSYLGGYTWKQNERDIPEKILYWKGDYIISYLCPWIIPEYILKEAEIAAINFHPAPPEYPGCAPINHALYNNDKEYGVTCHHMIPRVDSGKIIAVKRFKIYPHDTIKSSYKMRAYDHQLSLFYDIIDTILSGKPLPETMYEWRSKPYTKKEFDELCEITPDMSEDEVRRRVRATSLDVYQPYIELHGHRFEFKGATNGR